MRLDEQEMSRLMRSATDDLLIDTDRIVRNATRRGRAIRRRRNLAMLSGVTAVLVVTGIPLSVLLLLPGSSTPASPTAQASSQAASASPSSQPTGERRFAPGKDQMAATLSRLLPPGQVSEQRNWSDADGAGGSHALTSSGGKLLSRPTNSPASAFQAGSVVFDDGGGAALISVSLSAPLPGGDATGGDLAALCNLDARCSTVAGARLILQDDVPDDSGTGLVSNVATLLYDDGYTVIASATNSAAEKGVSTRELPPLTANELVVLASDRAWLL